VTRGAKFQHTGWAPLGDWAQRAACLESFLDCFFPYKGGSSAHARKICARCPVWLDCLTYATFINWAYEGIWGGTTPRERQRLRVGSLTIDQIENRLAALR